ncbi:MAG TPA: serine/threonine-protein kinase [Kofleriaceae bacterium]|jgi:serine/threonine-protein kinase|nr:serine/threonine-protein kinase [Kofleriaceae bacterium]
MGPTAVQGLQPGEVVGGRYVLRGCIGEGGMGSVFLADQPGLQRRVAIKVLHRELASEPVHARRLREEAMIASRVRSASCVGVIARGELPDGTPYLVMEYVPGEVLGDVIAGQPVPLARAVDVMEQVLRALGAVHAAGIVHGDVKSDNFLVETVAGRDRVTLIDFGLARLADAPHEIDLEDGEVMVSGTPEYMAPEIIAGEPPTRASDLYAAGVLLYELLTGTTPFGGGTPVEILTRHAREAVIPPSLRSPGRDLPPALDRVVLRALRKAPEARFSDAAAFARELRAAVAALRPPVARPEIPGCAALPASRTASHGPALPRRWARGSDCTTAVRDPARTGRSARRDAASRRSTARTPSSRSGGGGSRPYAAR